MPKYFDYKKLILKICTNQHLRSDQIFAQLQRYTGKTMSMSVLYKHIQELLATWKLKEVVVLGWRSYYETLIEQHAHLIDEEKVLIKDIPFPLLETSFLPEDFDISAMQLTIYWRFTSKKTA